MASKANAIGMPDDYQAECDLRTLIDAEKIKADKSRLKAAMAKHAAQKKAIDAIDAMGAKK
jgi:hypothetical protein